MSIFESRRTLWLSEVQERRKVEEQYVAGLRKLLVFKVPNAASELGFVALFLDIGLR
jgi:hypothetical protein